MIGASLAPRDRRVLAIGAITVTLLVAGTKGIPAWRSWVRDTRAEAAELAREAARAQGSVAMAGALRDSLSARRARLEELAPSVVEGDTPAVAAGALAELLSNAAAESNVRLGSVQLRTDTTSRATFSRVGLRADFTGDIIGVASMLYLLEGGAELLSIRELSITQPEPAAGNDRPEALRVSLLVEGLMLPGAKGGLP